VLLGERCERRVAEDIVGKLLSVLKYVPGLRRYQPIAASEVASRMLHTSLQPGFGCEYFRLQKIFMA
jgi:hypothetical protein